MGSLLKAICSECDFEKEFMLGGGMLDFTTMCNVPAFNKKTKKFVVKNYFEKDELKGEIVFYNDPTMFKRKDFDRTHQWGEVLLNAKNNFCPKCRSFTLDFECFGNFD